jgi:hypothetical protein
MSTYRGHANLNPNDPMYYAPRLRERSALRLSPSSEPSSERRTGPVSSSPAFDLLEEAVLKAPRRPLDPEVIHESPGFVRELDRRVALIRGRRSLRSSRRHLSPRGVVLRHHGPRLCPATGRRCFVPLWDITIDKNRFLSATSKRG